MAEEIPFDKTHDFPRELNTEAIKTLFDLVDRDMGTRTGFGEVSSNTHWLKGVISKAYAEGVVSADLSFAIRGGSYAPNRKYSAVALVSDVPNEKRKELTQRLYTEVEAFLDWCLIF